MSADTLRIYIATRLDQAESHHRPLADALRALGHTITYDWTTHGSVQGEEVSRIIEVARAEMEGITSADLCVVLLPGGRGTHVEIGIALAAGVPVLLVGEAEHFRPAVSFYYDAGVKWLYGQPLQALDAICRHRPRDRSASTAELEGHRRVAAQVVAWLDEQGVPPGSLMERLSCCCKVPPQRPETGAAFADKATYAAMTRQGLTIEGACARIRQDAADELRLALRAPDGATWGDLLTHASASHYATADRAHEVLADALGGDRDGELTVLGLAERAAVLLDGYGEILAQIRAALGLGPEAPHAEILATIRDRSRPLHLQLDDAAIAARSRAAALEAARDALLEGA